MPATYIASDTDRARDVGPTVDSFVESNGAYSRGWRIDCTCCGLARAGGSGRPLGAELEGVGDGFDRVLVDGVEGPSAAAFAVDDAGFGHALQMVGDSWLAQAEWLDEVAGAGLAVLGVEQHREQPQPSRVGEYLQSLGKGGGLVGVESAGV